MSTSSLYDLIIFDCDGVLVDSEALACVVHADVLTQHGYAISAEQVHDRFLGRSAREARLEVETELGRAFPDAYTAQLRATIDRVFGEQLQPVPYIADTLGRLSQRICVASSGTPTRIRSSLGTTGLLDRFAPHLFSAMQVERGKPAPDLFLFAAAQMNTPPARCVVVEDSVPGVTAARAAKMTVIGFTGGAHCRPGDADRLRAAGANIVIDDMRALPALIAQSLNRDEIAVV
ncbi:HAD superfamily hydrolase (TIGR01509 family) [Afipia massiliensis]|uniref:HAD superfamily hydrolase (TIGR01509 family) n=1 Tax=Afipia massiliensis TaxID=211460 RepID=A0A840MWB8_9BRAD|nr:HAD-IA family hydrolase [Afipia massiliensis]MBB5052193.1 HAD superfamily hydrolase (TIGR01509 family) [Afipia massiliensis]